VRLITLVLMALLGVAVCAPPVMAQPPGRGGLGEGPGGQPPPEPGSDMTPAEIQRIFDAYLIVQAQDALGLSEQQFAQFLGRLRTLQDTRRRNQQERNRILGDLQRLTNPRNPRPPDEAVLRERLNALQELEARADGDMRKAYAALDEVLDARQQARFRVFEEQIERKKLDLLMRARQNPGRNPNRPPAGRRPPGR
jgi:Spy/CpxP family protein refolding chaperone